MAKNDKTQASTDDKVMFDGVPGADKKTAEDAEGFKVDMNFEEEPKAEEDEIEFPKEAEVEEVEELKAEEEPQEETEETTETEESEVESEVAENTGEETVLADNDSDPQPVVEAVQEGVDEPKEPMIPKSRFDEVLAKQKALAKQLQEATNPVEKIDKAPEYDFAAKEIAYQEHILNGEAEKAAALRSEIRDAERQSMLFEVQERMGQTVQQSTEAVALQNKAVELQTAHPELDETSATYNADLTQEVMDLRDAFIIQGFSGADALDKAAKYVIKPTLPTNNEEPKKDVVGEKIVEKKKVANTTKKLEAAESQPPTLKGKNKVEKKIDLDVLSSEEFDALPAETLKRMRGDFG
jgi:hypothetical protein|tara:strand:+ start:425 stop:1483 length:1059 start_codon:yes stop_codon:yes gene_type:complete